MRITSFTRTCVLVPGAAIAQNATPAYGWTS
jgi:hypothetical protein